MEENTEEIKRPSFVYWGSEIGRAIAEMSISFPFRKFYNADEKGDGHPVLVLPGFMSSDVSTAPLRNFVEKLGYNAYGWEMGRNYAKVEFLDKLIKKVEKLYNENEEQITLIGWSLGGVFARQLAKERPNMIRQIITLGSPFMGVNKANNAAWLYNLLVKREKIEEAAPGLIKQFPIPAPVPTTAIYTKEDGIVPWQLCLEKEETYFHQNIQVRGSHLGLGVNPSVLKIIADRLKYKEATWVPFEPDGFFDDLVLYPSL